MKATEAYVQVIYFEILNEVEIYIISFFSVPLPGSISLSSDLSHSNPGDVRRVKGKKEKCHFDQLNKSFFRFIREAGADRLVPLEI